MIVSFIYPTTGEVTGGEAVIYEFANGLARLGVDVNFFHGPTTPARIASLDELPPICLGHGVRHHLCDSPDDPDLPAGDVIFTTVAPARLGLPATLVQGYRMLSEEWERDAFRSPGPKFCVATWLQDIGETYGVPRDRLLHLPPGIDHGRFAVTTPLGDRPIDVTVLHHPHREKGWPVAQAMLEILRRRRPDDRIVVFGRMLDTRIPPGVEVVDSPDHRRLAEEIYGRTRVFVQTSHNEGFGLTPVEAMACGAALVTTDCGGSRDYGLPGVTADVVPVDDPAALADTVEALLDDEPRRLRYGAAGADHVRMFDWDRSARILLDALERYVADPAPFLRPPRPIQPGRP
jgi:glycosyltransferase involved in cell wall biosynthesis